MLSTILMIQEQGHCPMCEMMAGWGWLGMLLMALFWVAVIAGAVWVIVRLLRGRSGRATGSSAHDILRERYARGEIDQETYQRMRSALDE